MLFTERENLRARFTVFVCLNNSYVTYMYCTRFGILVLLTFSYSNVDECETYSAQTDRVLGDACAVVVRRRPAERERRRRGRRGERELSGRVRRGRRHREAHGPLAPRALDAIEHRTHSAQHTDMKRAVTVTAAEELKRE